MVMRYCTLDELEQAIPARTLIELSNDDPSAMSYNVFVVEKAISYAEELCDGYLVARYTLPISPVPTIIKDAVMHIARNWLYQRRPEGGIPDAVKDGHKQALDTLRSIQKGEISLNHTEHGDVVESHDPSVFRVSAPKRQFGKKQLRGR